VATSIGLLLGFLVGGLAEWFVFVRQKHPESPTIIPGIFVTVLLLVVGVGVVDTILSTEWYSSKVRLRLRAGLADGARPSASPRSSTVNAAKLIKNDRDFICSETILDSVIVELDLRAQWGKRYGDGNPLASSWVREALRRRIIVSRVPGTYVVEVRVADEQAEEAVSIANSLAEACRSQRSDHVVTSGQGPVAIQVELLDHASLAGSSSLHNKWRQLASYAFTGLFLAFAAGGKTGWVLSHLESEDATQVSEP
jgi:capsular polysaccharide biosynthesis protein